MKCVCVREREREREREGGKREREFDTWNNFVVQIGSGRSLKYFLRSALATWGFPNIEHKHDEAQTISEMSANAH